MKTTSLRSIGAAVALALVALVGYLYFSHRTPASPAGSQLTPVSLRLQWITQAQFAGYYMAKEKGFYAEAGLDLKINPGGQDFNALTLVSAGSDTFGIWTADQVLTGIARGAPVTPLGAVFEKSLAAFMVHADSAIQGPKDFEGKTVGIYAGYDTETIYLHLLKKFNVDRTKIKETPLQYDLARFFTRQVDVWPAYVINQPIAAEQAKISVRLLTPEQFGLRLYSDILIANNAALQRDPSLAKKFLDATARGWDYAANNRDETLIILKRLDPSLNEAVQRRMLDICVTYIGARTPKFAMTRENWEGIASLLKEQAQIPMDFDVAAKFGLK